MKEIFLQISNRQDLSQDQVQAVFDRILKNEVSESQIAAFLMGLKTKGETADEITGIVRALKSHATVLPETFTDAMCNCGTGGDQSYSFNISTTVCFVLAAGGIRMAKAGNRSISSKSGSAVSLKPLESTLRHHQKPYLKHLMRLVWPLSLPKPCTQPCVLSVQLAKLLGFQRL